jgi:glutathione S-transferase
MVALQHSPPPVPNHVWVYGNDHSPWVQAVLLGLFEKNIDHTFVTVPPVSVILRSGVMMPMAKIDDGPWIWDSEKILVAIGYDEVKASQRPALSRVFGNEAMRRTDNVWNFWHAFSQSRDGHPSGVRRSWNHFWRAFPVFYFFTLIRVIGRSLPTATKKHLISAFSYFQDQLEPDADFLAGDTPNTADLQLFGLVQMCASVPGASLKVLVEEPKLERLRDWIAAMQSRLATYPRLYSAAHFDPKQPASAIARPFEQFLFWCGAATFILALPVSVAATFYYMRRVRHNGMQRM